MHAQPADAAVREERRAQERSDELRQRLEPAPSVRLPSQAGDNPRIPAEGICFALRSVTFAGQSELATDDELRASLAGTAGDDAPIGRCVGAAGFSILASRVQNQLIAKGFVTTRVFVPPQDVSQGTLHLVVVPGRLHSVRTASGQALPPVAPLQKGAVLNLRAMEQALENFKRVPTAEVDFKIEPSEEDATLGPGWSDVVVTWSQPRPWRLSLTADDGGTKATGRYQGTFTLSLDNALGLNDLFYATASRDLGGGEGQGERGTRAQTVHLSIPYGWWLVGATASTNRFYQRVAGASQTYVYSGTSATAEVKAACLLRRDAVGKTSAYVRAFTRSSSNAIDDIEIELQRRRVGGWELGMNHHAFVGPATLDLSAGYRRGTGAFGSRPAPEELVGEGTSRMALAFADAAVAVPFQSFGQRWRASSQWRAQWNRTPLTPQDRFSIGGRYTVRGFSGEQTLVAERGWLIRNELAMALGESGQEFFAWLDHGQVGGPSVQRLIGRSLSGAGIGLRGGTQAAAGAFQYEFFVGTPIGKPDGFQAARTTGGFSVSWSY
ncbi:ShlB/FhaC/HecB family hemolysin secretion/activation protein [Ramlibacter humi]|uniref:ShlB/FhaC/HecB family hemolysin secretion/activation protein n=1 Tax=Ramlibacter humi TaxID=2530451 RepID=A0A4Z0BI25_9BURK|nr:ShlB/FhaC/HecB family hemolysin secretion/activation protein [Ramlibacter humi]